MTKNLIKQVGVIKKRKQPKQMGMVTISSDYEVDRTNRDDSFIKGIKDPEFREMMRQRDRSYWENKIYGK